MGAYDGAAAQETYINRYLTFRIGSETCGIDINAVCEIIRTEGLREMPGLPDFMAGTLNLRGDDLPVMDMRRRFHKYPKAYDERTSIIVADLDSLSIGLLVDSVAEVLTVTAENVLKLPKIMADPISACLKGVGKYGDRAILVLDTVNLLTENEIRNIGAVL